MAKNSKTPRTHRESKSTNRTDSPATVIWLIQAHDDWQNALSSAVLSPAEIAALRLKLEDWLRQTFPDARAIVVIERLSGYSRNLNQHVFRVEVKPGADSETSPFPLTRASPATLLPLPRIGGEGCRA